MKLQIHHIEMCVSDPVRTVNLLTAQFGFKIVATRTTPKCEQTVVKTGKQIFVVTHRKEQQGFDNLRNNERWTIFCNCCENDSESDSKIHHIDSVFNIAIQVENLQKVLQHLRKPGSASEPEFVLIRDETRVNCAKNGSVSYAILKSCCGNIVHTLIEKSNYRGQFLPEFDDSGEEICGQNGHKFGLVAESYFDHVSLACLPGQTNKLIEWYSRAFGMRRFITNSDDSVDDGLVIGGEVGMRLKVMEFWKCSENGVTSISDLSDSDSDSCESSERSKWEPLKIVIVESLPDTTNTQIDIFIRDHGGPGLQHIGMYTSNIVETVQRMTANGVRFRRPPPAYYTHIGQLDAIQNVGENLEQLQKCGILLDSEADVDSSPTSANSGHDKYLMQIFTHPIFEGRETFFLEVIQRQGALGFGVGNVTALARSINAYNLTNHNGDGAK